MFERYTEKARRAIFFARCETSILGGSYIEAGHLLLGLLREDKMLANRCVGSYEAIQSLREQIESHSTIREHVSTSVDLPLSHECKRVLAYAAEEAERLNHKQIDTTHLLLALLRVESFAAQLLRERGLALDSVREEVLGSKSSPSERESAPIAGFDQWLAECEARGGIRVVKDCIPNCTFAIYACGATRKGEDGEDPAEALSQIQKRIDSIIKGMENAIANHEFEKARFYSDEERK